MAERFGGRYSPGGHSAGADRAGPAGSPVGNPPAPASPFRGRAASRVDVRALSMFLWPTPLLLAAFGALGSAAPFRMTLLLLAYGALMLGAWMLREGQRAEAAYEARAIARPPAFPRKIAAAVLAGAGVSLAAWLGARAGGVLEVGGQLVSGVAFGLLTVGAHVLAFGIDPLRSKGAGETIASAEIHRVAEALERAEGRLAAIEGLAHRMRDREIDARVTTLNATVRDMIRMVEKDPRDMDRARRYLNVYLTGAEEATRKFAENRERLADPALRTEYLALLTDLEGSFDRGREALLVNDRTDLEVEIEVLRDRLAQEGA